MSDGTKDAAAGDDAVPPDAPKPVPTPGHFEPFDGHRPWHAGLLIRFLLEPQRYAREHLGHATSAAVTVMTAVCGAAVVSSGYSARIAQQAVRLARGADVPAALARTAPPWEYFWVTVILGGLLAGVLRWFIGGWWYGVRVGLAGDSRANDDFARVAYVHADLLWAAPLVLSAVADTCLYDNFGAAWRAPYHLVVIPALCVSYWYSYLLVRGSFAVSRPRALFWFFIGPILLMIAGQTTAFVAGFVAAMRGMH